MTPNSDRPTSFAITTLGCPKNIADSRSMARSLIREGLQYSDSPEDSDFHIINTCTFIQSATEETIDTILDAAGIKKQNNQKLIVAGCFAQRYPEAITTDLPEVDLFFGTGKYELVGQILREKYPQNFSHLHRPILQQEPYLPTDKPYSYIKLSDGCNRGCHFCIIPTLRGKFQQYPPEQIKADVQKAVAAGAKEICLVSQDTVFYGGNSNALMELITEIGEIVGVELIRLLYLYPDQKSKRLLDVYCQPKIAPYFEAPIQHVSERVLKAMNRSGNSAFFQQLFARARQIANMEIRTSLILGYPGETAEDVDQILEFVEQTRPEKLALFAFSPQEGTKANSLKTDLADKEIAHRVNLVRQLHLNILEEIHMERVGKIYPAIIDEIASDGNYIARRYQDAPEIDEIVYIQSGPKLQIGDVGQVRIDSFNEYDMEGTWIDHQ